jgi:hypothetical protein
VLAGANNNLFTEHLVDALRGNAHTRGDGLIRVFEVFNHVAEKVRRAAPGRQHPIFKATDLEDNFPIALYCGGAKGVAAMPASAERGQVWRQLEEIFADLYPIGPQDQEIWARAGVTFPAFVSRILGARIGLPHSGPFGRVAAVLK